MSTLAPRNPARTARRRGTEVEKRRLSQRGGLPPDGCETTSRGLPAVRFFNHRGHRGPQRKTRGRQGIQQEGTARIQSWSVSPLLISPSVISVTSVVKKEEGASTPGPPVSRDACPRKNIQS